MLEKLAIAAAVVFLLWMLAVIIVGRLIVRVFAAHRRGELIAPEPLQREPGTARTQDFSKQ